MELVYYVIRQRGGWGVEYDGMCRLGRTTREDAIAAARERVALEAKLGRSCRIRIQAEGGIWEEDRSFAPVDDPRLA